MNLPPLHMSAAGRLTWRWVCMLLVMCIAVPAWPSASAGKPLASQASFANVRTGARKLSIAYLPPGTEYNFYLSAGDAIQQVVTAAGHSYVMRAPQKGSDFATQVRMTQEMVDNKVDALIVSVLSPEAEGAIAPVLARAVREGIAVVIINSDQRRFPFPVHAVVGVGQRNATVELGKLAARMDTRATQVGIITGEPGQFSAERVGGFVAGIAGSHLRVVDSVNGHWNTQGGYEAAMHLLRKYPGIGVIFAANDFEAIGAASAKAALQREDVLVFGYDGVPDALERIAQSHIAATVLTDSTRIGQVTAKVVLDIFAGRFKGGFVENAVTIIDGRNAMNFLSLAQREAIATAPSDVYIVAEALPGLTASNGTGLYWDIMRAVYAPLGIAVKAETLPLRRAQLMTERKFADAMLGHYRGDSTNLVFPQWHYGSQDICAVFKKAKLDWSGPQSLYGRRVAWILGSDYEKYLTVQVLAQPKTDRKNALAMLEWDRVDAFIDDRAELFKTFRTSGGDLKPPGFDHDVYRVEPLVQMKLYPAFSNTPRGMKLAEIFDDRIPQLLRSGELKALFEKWGYDNFPFAK